jgi:hypothetical protein
LPSDIIADLLTVYYLSQLPMTGLLIKWKSHSKILFI